MDDAVRGSDADYWPPPAACKLQSQPYVVPFIGAGVSQAAGMPGGEELRQAILAKYPKSHQNIREFGRFEELPLLLLCSAISNGDPEISRALRELAMDFWEESLDALEQSPEQQQLIENLLSVPSQFIVTFNYDYLLEATARRLGKNPQSWSGVEGVREATRRAKAPPSDDDELAIFHIHGSVKKPETIVLDRGDYQLSGGVENTQKFLAALATSKRICFLGTRLNEVPHLRTLQAMDPIDDPHPIFIRHNPSEPDPERLKEMDESLKEMEDRCHPYLNGVMVATYPTHDHMRGLIAYLARTEANSETPETQESLERSGAELAESRKPPRLDPQEETEGLYVPMTLREVQEDEDSEREDWLGLFGAGRPSRWTADQEEAGMESEYALANGHRDYVVGPPGSGKSQLLGKAAQLVSEQRHAVFIRLSNGPHSPAEPTTMLIRWLKAAGVDADEAMLENETLHLFFDGLDEVPPQTQEDVAGAIRDLGTRYPQHYITVASRPVKAGALFSTGGWRLQKIEADSSWQRRYLEETGHDLDELLEGRAGGDILRDLLELPFFLARAVAFHDDGRLKDLTAWGLVQQLVDDALDRDHDQLPLSVDGARAWLRDVALRMHLYGVVSLSEPQLAQIPIPGGVATSAILDSLVQRSMIREQADTYAFSHRIIGESLAAERLSAEGPTDVLLDAIVPQLPESGETGTRPDWRVPLALLLAEDEAWRESVKNRDPLQWARSVPAGAPAEERREAAETIWRTYLDWKIWVWNRERSDFLQDGAALSRLLAPGDLPEVVAEIQAGIDAESHQTQANALEVLAGANVVIEDDLRRILDGNGDTRAAVVRRHAALAARDLGLESLLDLVVERAVRPSEEVEAQDCSIAALALVPKERLVEVFTRLIEQDATHMIVMTRIDDMLEPDEAIAVLRVYAEQVDDPMSSEKDVLLDALRALEDDIDQKTAEDAVFCAASWEMADESVTKLISSEPEAALKAIRDATDETRGGWWWRGAHLVDGFSADQLEEAGLNEDLVARKRQTEERETLRSDGGAIGVPEVLEPAVEEDQDDPPNLEQLLSEPPDKDRTWLIQHNAHYFHEQAAELGEAEQEDFATRLQEWWPEGASFYNSIEFKKNEPESRSWTMAHWANAWYWYGAALSMPLSPEQWADLALSGVMHSEQTEWLRSAQTAEGVALLTKQDREASVREWLDAVRLIEGPIPEEVLDACQECLSRHDGDLASAERQLIKELSDADATNVLHALMGNDDLASHIRPYLAAAGDDDSIAAELEALIATLEAGERTAERGSLFWMRGITGEKWLPKLFEALKATRSQDEEEGADEPEEESSRSESPEDTDASKEKKPRRKRRRRAARSMVRDDLIWFEAPNVLVETIGRIGGESAKALYDELLAGDDGFRFLRHNRDEIADTELSRIGTEAAEAASESLGLPPLGVEAENGSG